jgi:lipoate-protein ligase A
MMTTTWRLVDTGPLPGPENMAIDEALLSCFDPKTSTPVLRLYGWSPPALSLGRFQMAEEVLDLPLCRDLGVPLVRRVTGGGVIFHADELTYSIVCAPRHIPSAATIKESFRVLTGFLLGFYRFLGIEARYAIDTDTPDSRLGVRTPFCFAGRESYDILAAGLKIGGNAQRRLKEVIFQHGSIPLRQNLSTALKLLREQPPDDELQTADLEGLGVILGEEALRKQMASAFAENLGVALRAEGLTSDEAVRADSLLLAKYRNDAWNLTGEEQ